MDQIDQFKLQALGNMKQTVDTLGKEVEKSKGYIARAEGVNQAKLEGAASPLTPIESKVTDGSTRQGRTRDRAVRPRHARSSTSATGRSREAARRERQRLNADLARRVKRRRRRDRVDQPGRRSSSAWSMPIGMFGFLAAVGLAIGVAALLALHADAEARGAAAPSTDLPNGEMVQRFDSYLYRTRRGPARAGAGRDRRDQRRSCRRSGRRWSGSTRSIPTRRMRAG